MLLAASPHAPPDNWSPNAPALARCHPFPLGSVLDVSQRWVTNQAETHPASHIVLLSLQAISKFCTERLGLED